MDTTFNSKDLIKQLVKEQHFTSMLNAKLNDK